MTFGATSIDVIATALVELHPDDGKHREGCEPGAGERFSSARVRSWRSLPLCRPASAIGMRRRSTPTGRAVRETVQQRRRLRHGTPYHPTCESPATRGGRARRSTVHRAGFSAVGRPVTARCCGFAGPAVFGNMIAASLPPDRPLLELVFLANYDAPPAVPRLDLRSRIPAADISDLERALRHCSRGLFNLKA